MYETNYSNEKQNITNGESKLIKNQFTKSLTSFHTKKPISKNFPNQPAPKKSALIKQDKSVKNKRVYLSSKKAKALNYLKLNSISPQNNLMNDLNKQEPAETLQKNKVYNAPSSVQRSYKYQNCYILNNLNNYQPHVIPGSLTKKNNDYIDKKLSESIEKYNDNDNLLELNNNNNSYTTSENRKTNGASSNINEINENVSLIQPSINGLNTITFNINNNYNNCYNNYEMNNYNKKNGFIQFNGYMNINGYEGLVNKSVCNSNDNKLEESDKDNLKNININIETDNKVINNKRSALFKDKSKNKTKMKQNAYSNTNNTNSVTNFNINNFKKSQKSLNYNEKNENNYNKNYIYETMDNILHNDDNNFPRTKNIYKFNKFNNNNKKIALNKRNFTYKENEIENTKSLNSLESSQKNQQEKNNDKKSKDNNNKENENPYQTYSGSFRNNNRMIKVNMIDTKKSAMEKINNEFNEENINSQKAVFKNNNKSTSNLKTLVDKYENKNSFGSKKYNKKNNSQSNKKINIINNNKVKFNEKNKNPKNILIQTYNNLKKSKDEDENVIIIKEDINQTNYNETNLNNNELQTKSVNCLNCYTKKNNIIPLTRENSTTYVRKKSLNMKIYNNVTKNNFLSNRPSAFKHKKNYSISSSCYNTQRNINKSNKKSNVYSPKNDMNKINLDEKTIVLPEYKIKLENIKSRINNLLNVYSLLALRAVNVPCGENKDKLNDIENVDKNNDEY